MKLVKLNTVQFCSNTLLKQLSWSSQLLHQLLKGNIGLPKMFEHKNFLIYIFFFHRKPLDSKEMDRVMEACDTALELDKYKSRIYSYVESRMTFIEPNLSVLVGAPIAAKLMGKQFVLVDSLNTFMM